MLRQSVPTPTHPYFRTRSHEVSRIEGFTDAVFAFAVTLLVVSLEVPKGVGELLHAMRGFVSFAVCFGFLLQLWWLHNRFFRRYALHDTPIYLLNGVFLFVSLFYVYPLKFLFGAMFGAFTVEHDDQVTESQIRWLFTVYSIGAASVFLTYALMHVHAYRRRAMLDLSPAEKTLTIESTTHALTVVGFGILSILIAWTVPIKSINFAGWIYALIAVPLMLTGSHFGKKARLQFEASNRPAPAPPTESPVPRRLQPVSEP